MRLALACLAVLTCAEVALVGCAAQGMSSSTPVDFMNAVSKDPATGCFIVSTPYGGIISGRAVPGAKVELAGGSCSIDTRSPAP